MHLITIPAPGGLAQVDVPTPVPGPGEVRIRVQCVGICGSDVEVFMGYRDPKVRYGHPVLGHELAGTIDAVGDAVSGLRVGDRATCIEGWGALAEYVVTTPEKVLCFDDRIRFEDGCLLEVLPGAAMAAWCTGIDAGSHVLIVGQGLSGLVITRLIRFHGCRRLVVVDPHRDKLAVATEFGADEVRLGQIAEVAGALAEDHISGFDVAVMATPRCHIDEVVPLMRSRSRIVAYGGLDERCFIDMLGLHRRSVSLIKEGECIGGVREARRIWREALDAVYDGVLPLRRLRTHDLPMGEAQAAFELRADPSSSALHVVLHADPAVGGGPWV